MLQSRLNKLPKELLIKLLLTIKKDKIYKVEIKPVFYGTEIFYIKALSKDHVIKQIRESKEKRPSIIGFWKYKYRCCGDDFYKTWYYRNGCLDSEGVWTRISNTEEIDQLALTHFDQMFNDYMEYSNDEENISIEEIKIVKSHGS